MWSWVHIASKESCVSVWIAFQADSQMYGNAYYKLRLSPNKEHFLFSDNNSRSGVFVNMRFAYLKPALDGSTLE